MSTGVKEAVAQTRDVQGDSNYQVAVGEHGYTFTES
jgi:hypothetical protein